MEMAWQQALSGSSGVNIVEKVSLLEAASAAMGQEIEMANKYNVKDRSTGASLFYIVETTDCCTRQIKSCLPDCVPWGVDIFWTGDGALDKVMRLERAWTCTCLCFNRPTVYITDANTGSGLGYVTDPCNLCGSDLAAHDASGNKQFSANGGCCQLGAICPMPCGPCSKVEYDLQDADGQSIGTLTKKVPGCLKFLFAGDAQNYEVEFGQSPVWEDPMNKALMIGLAIFMDFRYFSENPNDESAGVAAAASFLGE